MLTKQVCGQAQREKSCYSFPLAQVQDEAYILITKTRSNAFKEATSISSSHSILVRERGNKHLQYKPQEADLTDYSCQMQTNQNYAMTSGLLLGNMDGFNFKHSSVVEFDSLRMQMQIHILMSKSWTVTMLQF